MRYSTVSALLVTLAMVAGCGPKPETGAEVIKIGSVAPLTGP